MLSLAAQAFSLKLKDALRFGEVALGRKKTTLSFKQCGLFVDRRGIVLEQYPEAKTDFTRRLEKERLAVPEISPIGRTIQIRLQIVIQRA